MDGRARVDGMGSPVAEAVLALRLQWHGSWTPPLSIVDSYSPRLSAQMAIVSRKDVDGWPQTPTQHHQHCQQLEALPTRRRRPLQNKPRRANDILHMSHNETMYSTKALFPCPQGFLLPLARCRPQRGHDDPE
jgi:hypothetical protein